MKLIKSIVRPNKVDEVKDALERISVSGMVTRREPDQLHVSQNPRKVRPVSTKFQWKR